VFMKGFMKCATEHSSSIYLIQRCNKTPAVWDLTGTNFCQCQRHIPKWRSKLIEKLLKNWVALGLYINYLSEGVGILQSPKSGMLLFTVFPKSLLVMVHLLGNHMISFFSCTINGANSLEK
jgi:hypothetical protein